MPTKAIDPLPQSFNTIEEFVEFWDTHSAADYPEAFREIKTPVHIEQRQHYRVALSPRVWKELAEQAQAKGMTLDRLVDQLLSAQLPRPS